MLRCKYFVFARERGYCMHVCVWVCTLISFHSSACDGGEEGYSHGHLANNNAK